LKPLLDVRADAEMQQQLGHAQQQQPTGGALRLVPDLAPHSSIFCELNILLNIPVQAAVLAPHSLADHQPSTVHLHSHFLFLQVKDCGIVLFAYPKASTKGCTSQAVGLSEKADELAAAGYKVYGISADKPKSQANWRSKENISFNLLCDPSYEVRDCSSSQMHAQ
jgi:hypothetical protein